jgi:hypothetical protein
MKKILILLFILPMLQGCALGILAAGVGYAVGQGRKGTAAEMEAKSKYTSLYNDYKLGMEKINLEREKSNLQPQPILSFEDWVNQQPLTPEEQKIFRKYQSQTPNEIKEQK